MLWSVIRRFVAVLSVVALVPMSTTLTLHAASAAVFRGRVLGRDGVTPRAGTVVNLYDAAAEKTFSSSPTDARGVFRVDTAPPGTYAVVVEAPEGAFLAGSSLTLHEGANTPMALALKPNAEGEPPAGVPVVATPPAAGISNLAKWAIVGGLALGAIFVVDGLTSEDQSSPTGF